MDNEPGGEGLSNEKHARMVAAFVAKAKRFSRDGYTEDEWLVGLVSTVIADSYLVLSGTLRVEDFE